jgi:hypothetical protein
MSERLRVLGAPTSATPRMTEDELLAGITEALTLAGWRWTHIRRSDTVTMGMSGLPDIIAAHVMRDVVLAWELKSEHGTLSGDQAGWLTVLRNVCVDARVIRPVDYDRALQVIIGGAHPRQAFDG